MAFPGTDLSFLAGGILAGNLLAQRFTVGLSALERLVVGAIAGIALSTWLVFLASMLAGSLSSATATMAFSIAFILLLLLIGRNALMGAVEDASQLATNAWREAQSRKLVTLVLVLLGLWFALLYARAWFPTDSTGAISSAGYVWGDGAFHMTVANSFVKSDNFPPQYPIFSGARLGYPFLADFQASVMLALGSSPIVAFGLTGWLELILALLAVYLLVARVTRRPKVAALSIVLLVFNGGLGFLNAFGDLATKGLVPAVQTLAGSDLARIPMQSEWYTNFITSVFLPQRPFAYGLAAVAAVLLLLYVLFVEGKRPVDFMKLSVKQLKAIRPALVFAGVLAASTVLFHAHSVLVLVLILVLLVHSFKVHNFLKGRWNWSRGFKRNWRMVKATAWFWIPFVILALPQALWSLPQLGHGSFIRLEPFWMANTLNPITGIGFWLLNAGPFLLLALLGMFQNKELFKKFLWPFVVLWVIANLVILEPYDYDNLKLLLFAHAALAVPAALALASLWNARRTIKISGVSVTPSALKTLAVVLLLASVATGAQSTFWQSQRSDVLYTPASVTFSNQLDGLIPPHAIVLTGATHNHPVPSLLGREVVMGYRGWLWTHAFDYNEREADVKTMYAGGENATALFQKYGVSYAVVGPDEKEFKPNNAFFSQFPVVLTSGGRTVYRVA